MALDASLLGAAGEDEELTELKAEDELLDELLAAELNEDALLEELAPSSSFASPPQAASNAANRATLIFFMSISGFLPTSDAGAIYDLPMDKVLSEGTYSLISTRLQLCQVDKVTNGCAASICT